jgi:hypothetical protein
VTAVRLFVACTLTFLCALGNAFAQRAGRTQSINVPFRSESWSQTAGSSPRSPGRVLPLPYFLQANHAQVSTAGSGATSSSSTSTSLVGQVFPGPVDQVPPDSDIAAGPNDIVATVNSVITVYDKTGKFISQTEAAAFFANLPGANCCFDLRVLYDQADNRFVVAAGETDFNTPVAHIFVAVSATSDPTGNWYKFAVDASNSFWSDFPSLGLSATALYVTTDRIPFTAGPAHWDVIAIQLPELLSGNPKLRITSFANVTGPSGAMLHGPIIPALTYGSGPEYFVSNGPPGVLYVFSMPTTGALTLTSTVLNTVPYPEPPLAPQPGSSVGLGVGGDAIFTVVSRNGSLWVSQSVGSGPGTPAANAVIRWYEIDPSGPSVRQLGTVVGAGDAFTPALTVRADGQADLVYSTSSATQFASAGYAHRNPTDSPNTMPVSGIYTAGDSVYPLSRWGDISGISVDPDGTSAWGIAEYATKGSFGTSIIKILSGITLAPALSLTISPSSQTISAGQSATFSISTSGQGLTAPITLACTQGLPTGALCVFSPDSVASGGSASLRISTQSRGSALILKTLLPFALATLFGTVLLTGRRYRGAIALVTMLICLALLVSCGGVSSSTKAPPGGGGSSPTGTPAGSYSVTITGTSGSTSASSTLSLVVQ